MQHGTLVQSQLCFSSVTECGDVTNWHGKEFIIQTYTAHNVNKIESSTIKGKDGPIRKTWSSPQW